MAQLPISNVQPAGNSVRHSKHPNDILVK